jgi:hypothetical protein
MAESALTLPDTGTLVAQDIKSPGFDNWFHCQISPLSNLTGWGCREFHPGELAEPDFSTASRLHCSPANLQDRLAALEPTSEFPREMGFGITFIPKPEDGGFVVGLRNEHGEAAIQMVSCVSPDIMALMADRLNAIMQDHCGIGDGDSSPAYQQLTTADALGPTSNLDSKSEIMYLLQTQLSVLELSRTIVRDYEAPIWAREAIRMGNTFEMLGALLELSQRLESHEDLEISRALDIMSQVAHAWRVERLDINANVGKLNSDALRYILEVMNKARLNQGAKAIYVEIQQLGEEDAPSQIIIQHDGTPLEPEKLAIDDKTGKQRLLLPLVSKNGRHLNPNPPPPPKGFDLAAMGRWLDSIGGNIAVQDITGNSYGKTTEYVFEVPQAERVCEP